MTERSIMTNGTNMHTHDHMLCKKSICWTAIFMGAFVGIGLSFLLNLFGVALGLSIFTTSTEGVKTLAIGGLVGLLIGVIISMYLAGWTAGYLGRPYCYKRNLGTLYGFVTWSIALILTILLTSHVGRYVNSFSNSISNPTMLIVTNTPNNDQVNTANMANSSSSQPPVAVVDQKMVATSAIIAFVLFFIGALSCCFGAHFGMCYKDRDDEYLTDSRPGV